MAADKLSSVNRPTTEETTVAAQLQAAKAEVRRERSLIGQLAEILKFADLMAIMMVLATAFSALATWRTASITNMLVSIAERPYIGVQRVAFDTVESDGSGRLLIDCRNFGHVSGSDGVVRIRLVVDGKTISSRALDHRGDGQRRNVRAERAAGLFSLRTSVNLSGGARRHFADDRAHSDQLSRSG